MFIRTQNKTTIDYGKELWVTTLKGDKCSKDTLEARNNLIELIIPRDPNIIFPEMILQNVTNYNESFYFKLIHLKDLKPNKNLTISIHFEIRKKNHVSYRL